MPYGYEALALVMSYGVIDLGEHRLRQWFIAWWQQAITWTNVDLSLMEFYGIRLTTSLQDIN